ncbi:MAG: DUF11 domain-containing protein, partial [Mariprofundaceae bacterium]|nr:DUF11 domain-containing protein [Mariprofundaceae bacterium]
MIDVLVACQGRSLRRNARGRVAALLLAIIAGWQGFFALPATAAPASGVADLSIEKQARPDPVMVGGELKYTITAVNHGPALARDVAVTDRLPTEVTLKSIHASPGSCDTVVGVPICDVGDLKAGASASITITVHVDEM